MDISTNHKAKYGIKQNKKKGCENKNMKLTYVGKYNTLSEKELKSLIKNKNLNPINNFEALVELRRRNVLS